MPDILAVTAWDVPEEGFQWVQAYTSGRSVGQPLERFLVPKVKASPRNKRYWPLLDTPALFRTFAETDPTEAGILEFASRYGGPERCGARSMYCSPMADLLDTTAITSSGRTW